MSCYNKYVGETGRKLSINISEHRRASNKGDLTNMPAAHKIETGHQFNFTECNILGRQTNANKRLYIEAAHIKRLGKDIVNGNVGKRTISKVWAPILNNYHCKIRQATFKFRDQTHVQPYYNTLFEDFRRNNVR